MIKMLSIFKWQILVTLGRRQKRMRRGFSFLCACALTVMSMTLGASRVYAAGEQLRTYTLEAKGERLGEVIQKLAEMSEYEINLDSNWEGFPVSVSIRNVTLYEGLNLLLNRINKAILIDTEEKKCSILVFDSFADHQSISFGPSGVKPNFPAKNGHSNISLSSENTFDPLDVVALPPSVSGEKGINTRELAELEKNLNQLYDENREIIPPTKPGEKGITARELAGLERHQNQIDLDNREVLPPKKTGEKGITQRELKAIQSKQQQINMENLVELPPKMPQKKH